MDIQAYIESGILEAYILGTASDKERREVECLSKIHEEIAQEMVAIQETMEKLAQKDAIAPPQKLRQSILDQLPEQESKVISLGTAVKPAEANIKAEPESIEKSNTGNSWLRIAAAVAILIAGAFSYLYMQNGNELTGIKKELAAIVDSRDHVNEELKALKYELSQTKTELAFLQDTATLSVPMKGIPEKAPTALATVFWNTRSNEAYISVASMPDVPEGKQYQLWAIVNGTPTDMGVFELEVGNHLQKVAEIQGAVAFAVTLEKAGGSPTPTLTEMYVIGNVNG